MPLVEPEGDANGYLEEHGLVVFMQFLMDSLTRDKPADPYPFLQQQIAQRMASKASGTGAETLPSLSGKPPFLSIPPLQESEAEVESLLERVSPAHAVKASPEQLQSLEKEAESARRKLLEDNAVLRETAMQMNLEYEKLMRESASLHGRLDAKRGATKNASITQEVSHQGVASNESSNAVHKDAYREIEKLQDEVSQLARENAKLVSDLARGREMIDLVRKDMVEIQRSMGE
jgi:hypothetical protein